MNKDPNDIINAAYRQLGQLGAGGLPSKADKDLAWFHLESIIHEFPADTPSQWSITLAFRLAGIQPAWVGDTVESIPSASALIAAESGVRVPFPSEELEQFYAGEQWDSETRQYRESKGRPTLVVNRLPALVSASLEKEGSDISRDDLATVRGVITLRNMDAQRLYNYMVSAFAEQASLRRCHPLGQLDYKPAG